MTHPHLDPTGTAGAPSDAGVHQHGASPQLLVPGLSRRAALVGAGAIVAGAVASTLVLPGPVSASGLVTTYALDPTLSGTCVSPGCSVCNACLGHAANKIFASLADAEANRAHPNCRCVAVTGISVSQDTYDQLFASATVADRRHASVGALLATPSSSVTAPGISGFVPALVTAGGLAALGVVAARARRTEPA